MSKSYSSGSPALDNVSLTIKRGIVFIVGDSGSGKSTLIKLLLRELTPTSGRVIVNGADVARLKRRQVPKFRRNLGIVFQDFRLLNDRNVYENVAFAQRVIQMPTKLMRKKCSERAGRGRSGRQIQSEDQTSSPAVNSQRVALARALVNEPPILLADEPTGNLDPKTSEEIMKLLEQINERGTTVLVVTHNKEIVNAMKKRVVTMHDGVIVSDEKEGEYHEA